MNFNAGIILNFLESFFIMKRFLIIFFFLYLLSGLCLVEADINKENNAIGIVGGIEGQLFIKKEGESLFQEAFTGNQLYGGEVLKTNENSRAVILFNNGNRMKLNALTVVTISHQTKSGKIGEEFIKVNVGEIWANFVKNKEKKFYIITPTVSGGIRGTEINVKVEQDGKTTFTVVRGIVELENEYGSVVLNDDEQSIVEPGQAPFPPKKVDVEKFIDWIKDFRLNISLTIPLKYKNSELREKALKEAENLPEDLKSLVMGQIALDSGDIDKARLYFDKAYNLGLKNPEVLMGIANCEFLSKNWEKAEGICFDVIKEYPDTELPYNMLGKIKLGEIDFPEAEKYFAKALQLDGRDVEALVGLGNCRLLICDFTGSEILFNKALEIDPLNSTVYQSLGLLYSVTGDTKKAISSIEKALYYNPYNVELLINLACEYGRVGEYEKAESILKSAINRANNSEKIICYSNLSSIYFIKENYKSAFEMQIEALKLGQENVVEKERFNNTTVLYVTDLLKKKDYSTALQILEKARKYIGGFSDCYLLAGEVHYYRGDYLNAFLALKKSIELKPFNPFAYYYLGLVYLDTGNNDKSAKNLEISKAFFKDLGNLEYVFMLDTLINEIRY